MADGIFGEEWAWLLKAEDGSRPAGARVPAPLVETDKPFMGISSHMNGRSQAEEEK